VKFGKFHIHPATVTSNLSVAGATKRRWSITNKQGTYEYFTQRSSVFGPKKLKYTSNSTDLASWTKDMRKNIRNMFSAEYKSLNLSVTYDDGFPALVLKNKGHGSNRSILMQFFESITVNKDEIMMEFHTEW